MTCHVMSLSYLPREEKQLHVHVLGGRDGVRGDLSLGGLQDIDSSFCIIHQFLNF